MQKSKTLSYVKRRALPKVLSIVMILALSVSFITTVAGANELQTTRKILVSPPGYDNIGEILDEIGFSHIQMNYDSEISLSDLESLADFDTIFINCGTYMDSEVAREFVERGGLLYASDLTMGDFIAEAFAERGFEFTGLDAQGCNGIIVDEGLRIIMQSHFGQGDTVEINFDLGGWQVVTSPLGDGAVIFIEGEVEDYEYDYETDEYNYFTVGTFPFAFMFPHGDGKVFYTSFHYNAQMTDEVRTLLSYLLIFFEQDDNVSSGGDFANEHGFENFTALPGTLEPNEAASFQLTFNAGEKFGVLNTSNNTADFKVTITSPDNINYSNVDESGSFVTGVVQGTPNPNAASSFSVLSSSMTVTSLGADGLIVENADGGDWGLTVTSLTSESSVYTVGIATGVAGADAQDAQLIAFVVSLYQNIQGREPDSGGLEFWVNGLQNGTHTGASTSGYFFFSEEYLGRNRSNEEFLDDLYNTCMGRPGDPGGIEFWLSMIAQGASRKLILNAFLTGPEFAERCAEFGVEVGRYTDNLEFADMSLSITRFIFRCYDVFLDRIADRIGLNNWTGHLINKVLTPTGVANYFVTSEEFVGFGYNNEQFLDAMYQGMMGREPDEGGYNHWMSILEANPGAAGRQLVFNGFAQSEEWKGIVADFGL